VGPPNHSQDGVVMGTDHNVLVRRVSSFADAAQAVQCGRGDGTSASQVQK
jgi:hypothetical protein